ncbi:hypothetical protein B4U80_07664 [Leptotrombidium deliense]|uniref:G-protein coupled receptors family 1 profile domain-containing protein n=1 Tax=Leptotrombidium deliense TaxID=299467 RepID=A0A443SGX2_9ACAR|nr:hypothetical protein B4U80_07664 [Leptotrombidium deliense]
MACMSANKKNIRSSYELHLIATEDKFDNPSRLGKRNADINRTSNAHNSQCRESIEAKRERKAAKILVIITVTFLICWIPFFFFAILLPLCGEYCNPGNSVLIFVLWLGWVNSTLNPIIYTVFSPEFRAAFERILLGRKPNRNSPCSV